MFNVGLIMKLIYLRINTRLKLEGALISLYINSNLLMHLLFFNGIVAFHVVWKNITFCGIKLLCFSRVIKTQTKGLFIPLVLFTVYTSIAQQRQNAIPPSPTPAALGKFADTPVSYYTGTTSIGIPIWDLRAFDLSIPVSLNYHSGGIRVDEVASWIGLGWSLDAGGAITRTVRGIPDDGAAGFLNSGPIPSNGLAQEEFRQQLMQLGYGQVDGEPDLFYFNFGGKTGKFVLDKAGVPHLIPHQKLKIETNNFNSWTITTENGTKYIFSETEITNVGITACTSKALSYVSTWYLKEIVSPVHVENKITLSYIPQTITQAQQTAETDYQLLPGGGVGAQVPRDYPCDYSLTVSAKRLSKITSTEGTIEFVADADDRTDLPGDFGLDKILIKHNEDVIREFTLSHSYLSGRYMLDQVVESSQDIKKGPYRFYYHSGLPSQFSPTQDHWGFNNGKSGNATLLPAIVVNPGMEGQEMFLKGANRSVDINYAIAGSLHKVSYPTGGFTEYDYESNESSTGLPIDDFTERSYNLDVRSEVSSVEFTIHDPLTTSTRVTIQPYHYCEEQTPYSTFIISRKSDGGGGAEIGPVEFASGQSIEMFLANDTYVITYRVYDPSIPGRCDGHGINVTWLERNVGVNKRIGGLRIAQITDFDNTGSQVLKKRYTYTTRASDGSEVSSGEIINRPQYGYYFQVQGTKTVSEGDHELIIHYTEMYYARTSTSNYPLGTTHGSHVGYKQVTEEYIDTRNINNGKSIYKYTIDSEGTAEYNVIMYDQSDWNGGSSFPFPPFEASDWAGGRLIEKSDYKRLSDGSYRIVKNAVYSYNTYYAAPTSCIGDPANTNCRQIGGIKVGFHGSSEEGPSVRYAYFTTSTGYSELREVNLSTFYYTHEGTPAETINEVKHTTNYVYNKEHLQPTQITESGSDEVLITYNTYPLDYPVGTTFIDDLVSKHIHTPLIESVVTKYPTLPSDPLIISCRMQKYNSSGLMTEVYTLDNKDPLTPTNFKFSNRSEETIPLLNNEITSYTPDPKYTLKESLVYDARGNLIQHSKGNDFVVSYLWANQFTDMIAEVRNSNHVNIYHTSFEDTGEIDATAVSGRKVHIGNYLLIPPSGFVPLPGSKLSYWQWNGTNWIYMQQLYAGGSITLQGQKIDEVRIVPPAGKMKTYTHLPLVGVKSTTDSNNNTTHYEYDLLGRLSLVLDSDRNIQSQYKYRYVGQP
jgi:YD repeat-containing protein